MVAKAGEKAFTKRKPSASFFPYNVMWSLLVDTHKLRGFRRLRAHKEAERSLKFKRPPRLGFIHSLGLSLPPTHLPSETMSVQWSPGTVCGERRSVIAFLYLPIKPAYKAFHSLIVSAPDSLTGGESGSIGSWQSLSVLGPQASPLIILWRYCNFFGIFWKSVYDICFDLLFLPFLSGSVYNVDLGSLVRYNKCINVDLLISTHKNSLIVSLPKAESFFSNKRWKKKKKKTLNPYKCPHESQFNHFNTHLTKRWNLDLKLWSNIFFF